MIGQYRAPTVYEQAMLDAMPRCVVTGIASEEMIACACRMVGYSSIECMEENEKRDNGKLDPRNPAHHKQR